MSLYTMSIICIFVFRYHDMNALKTTYFSSFRLCRRQFLSTDLFKNTKENQTNIYTVLNVLRVLAYLHQASMFTNKIGSDVFPQ